MYRKILPAIVFTSLILFGSFVLSDTPVERINKALNVFFEKFPQEKVYLQFDKPRYTIGDTVWYKGYVTYKSAPSTISKILYVELIDDHGKILKRQTLPVDEGGASGDIVVGGEFPAGDYYVRAYTSWMLNFDPAFFFYNKISIGLEAVADADIQNADSANCNLRFFPEGGSLVEGLTSLVAFKAENAYGQPVNIEGKIVDSSGKEVAVLKTVQDGMGSFVIHPLRGNTYSAIIELSKRERKKISLPEIKSSGIVFHTETVNSINGDSVYFRISRSINNKGLFEHLVICAEMEGVSDFMYVDFDSATAGNYNNTILTAPSSLPIDQFPPGILHLSVFNESGELLAQRLVFLRGDQQAADLQATALSFAPHAKNTFTCSIPGDEKGNYSVSVTDADAEKGADQNNNIVAHILLASDLRNTLQHPGVYFDSQHPRATNPDLVMLTNAWSRFSWNDILQNKFPAIKYYAEQSLAIRGRAFRVKNKNRQPLQGGDVPIMIKNQDGSLNNILSVPLDSAGYFSISNLDFHDTATIYMKNSVDGKKNKEQDIAVQFDKNPLDSVMDAFMPRAYRQIWNQNDANIHKQVQKTTAKDTITDKRQYRKDKNLLAPVTITAKIKTHTDSTIADYATGFFASPNSMSKTIDFTNDKVAGRNYQTNVLDYIIANVPGLQVHQRYDKQNRELDAIPYITWRESFALFYGDRQAANVPAIYLNESQLTGEGGGSYSDAISLLKSIPLANVAMIRIFEPGGFAAVSGNAPNGAIAIYTTNKPEARDYESVNNFNRIKKSGYSDFHEFSSPDYAIHKNIRIPDDRTTLYWNPHLETDSVNHVASFSFFNNDVTKRFHVIIEGVDAQGKIVRIDKIFQ